MIRKLFAIFVALAVLLAPAISAVAMAAAPHHEMEMVSAGHCQTPPSSSGHREKLDGKNCCIAMCMAVAVAPSAPTGAMPVRRQIAQFVTPRPYQGVRTEIATPPPRHA